MASTRTFPAVAMLLLVALALLTSPGAHGAGVGSSVSLDTTSVPQPSVVLGLRGMRKLTMTRAAALAAQNNVWETMRLHEQQARIAQQVALSTYKKDMAELRAKSIKSAGEGLKGLV